MLLVLAVAGLALNLLVWWFASLEIRGERHKIVVVLGLVLLIEAVLAGPAADVPRGFLRPDVAGQDFRPPDAVIVAALAARVLNLGQGRVSTQALWWSSFLVIYMTGAAVGILNGLPVVEVLFQSKGAFYIVGGMIVGSGADMKRLAESLPKVGLAGAGVVLVGFVVSAANLRLSFAIPGQRFNRLGNLSNDSITLLVLLGVMVLLVESTREHARPLYSLSGLLLLLSPAAGHQRASYLVLAICVLILGALVASPTWRRRSAVTVLEISLVFAGLLALVGVNFIFNDAAAITSPLEDAFSGAAEQRSAASRFSLADQAIDRIQERPILGWGNGIKVTRQAALSNREVSAAAHNLILDVWMRLGVVGLILMISAIGSTTLTGLRIWRDSISRSTAAIGAAATIAMWGVITKGMVEPALDKFRLSLTMGLAIGLVIAAHRESLTETDPAEDDSLEQEPSTPVPAERESLVIVELAAPVPVDPADDTNS